MSSNGTDTFDSLMNEISGAAVSIGEDAPAENAENVEIEEASEEAEVEDPGEVEEEAPAESEADAESEDSAEEEAAPEEEVEEAPKIKGKKTAQERIAEVVAKQRQAERERDAERAEKAAFAARIEALEAKLKGISEDSSKPAVKDEFGLIEPTENDLDADGNPKYPLGAFDPQFMRDISRYDRAVEKAYEAQVTAEVQRKAAAQAEEERLIQNWNTRLDEVQKTSPKIREKAQILVDALDDSDPQHMQVLAQTIMTLENGPAVMEYLADNLDEANTISRMPTHKALLQLGRLDGLFIPQEEDEEPEVPIKPTHAPKPPVKLARGSGAGQGSSSLYDKMLKDFR